MINVHSHWHKYRAERPLMVNVLTNRNLLIDSFINRILKTN
jgi:hypothetical protein